MLDLKNEVMVKVAEDGTVLTAYRGLQKLESDEIKLIYGDERKFRDTPYDPWTYRDFESGYAGFHTYFVSPAVALIWKMIELKNQGKLDKTVKEIFDDIKTCISKNYVHFDAKQCYSINEYGYFLPELARNSSEYIEYRRDLRQMVQKLKDMGKKLFVATNSHVEYMELIMTASIGEDWKDFFDFKSAFCGKPAYFKLLDTKRCFYREDSDSPTLLGKECHADDLDSDHIYLKGNWVDLELYFKRITGKDKINFLYFGDHYITDAAISDLHSNWKGVSVMEEWNHESHSPSENSNLVNYQKYWGSYFGDEVDGVWKKSAWVKFAEEHTSFVVKVLSDIINVLE